jgi:flagellar assembly protein FliH
MASELGANNAQGVKALEKVSQKLMEARAACRDELEQLVLMTATAVARQVIRQEVTTEPAVLLGIVRRALDEVSWDSTVELRVHPQTIELLRDLFDALEPGAKPNAVEWIPDPSVGVGGCLVRTPGCLIDGSLSTVLDDMFERMTHA